MSHAQVEKTGEVNVPPPAVQERIDRILAFHEATKKQDASFHPDQRPSPFRVFTDQPKIALPTKLLDAPTGTLRVLDIGVSALPESMQTPPQDLETLATWLNLAAGITGKVPQSDRTHYLRAYPSAGALYPTEIYVLALGIQGLEPALYHFSAKEFSLRKLRDGWESISQIKRGRPDLELLKTMPAIVLVSTICWRSAWRYGSRGYRYCAIDAGHVIENFVQTGAGLGMQTFVRMHLNERNARELIGLEKPSPFGEFEAVHGFVAWADKAQHPIQPPAERPAPSRLAPIKRASLSNGCSDCPGIPQAHDDCIAPGVGVVEVRSPLTENCPVGEGKELFEMSADDGYTDRGLLQTIRGRRSVRKFTEHGISRDQFEMMNRLAFRSGSYYPVSPKGQHMGLIRAYWFVNKVNGVSPGLWYYHANYDRFTPVRYGDFRFESKYLCNDQEHCGNASALCLMVADLRTLMQGSSPDAYRLAHLEAGICTQRLYLACTAMYVECTAIGSFLDEDVIQALELTHTSYQCIFGFAVGAYNRPKSLDVVLPPDPAAIQFKAPA